MFGRPPRSTPFPYTPLFRSPTSVTTENPDPHRKGRASRSEGTPTAAIDDIEAAYSDVERPSRGPWPSEAPPRSEEHTSELQSRQYIVCRLLLEKTTIPSSLH